MLVVSVMWNLKLRMIYKAHCIIYLLFLLFFFHAVTIVVGWHEWHLTCAEKCAVANSISFGLILDSWAIIKETCRFRILNALCCCFVQVHCWAKSSGTWKTSEITKWVHSRKHSYTQRCVNYLCKSSTDAAMLCVNVILMKSPSSLLDC